MNRIAERLRRKVPELAVVTGIIGAITMAIGGYEAPSPVIPEPPTTRYSSVGRPIFDGPVTPPHRWTWDQVTGDENHRTNARCPHCKYPMQLRSAKGRIVCRGCGNSMTAQAAVSAND